MDSRHWAFTDLRSRSRRAPFSPAETPRSNDPRGWVEDYGEEDPSSSPKGIFRPPWVCLRRCQTMMMTTTMNPRLLAMVAVLSSALCIHMTESLLAKIASTLTLFLTIVLLLQQHRLRSLGMMKRQNNELRRQTHYLRQERERLHRNMDRSDQHVADLNHIPHE